MARHPDPRIRARLRDRAVDYVLSHGVWDLSLRPLAKAIKTNARMLIYHFGSREGLMREILAGLREREDELPIALAAALPVGRRRRDLARADAGERARDVEIAPVKDEVRRRRRQPDEDLRRPREARQPRIDLEREAVAQRRGERR